MAEIQMLLSVMVASGAAAGSAAGPYGAAIGTVAGVVAGLINSNGNQAPTPDLNSASVAQIWYHSIRQTGTTYLLISCLRILQPFVRTVQSITQGSRWTPSINETGQIGTEL